jgi:signal transduction histidine kinase
MWPKSVPHALTTGAVAAIGAAILIFMTIFVVFSQERAYRRQKLQEIVAQAHVLAASVTAPLVFDDPQAAQTYISALGAYPELDAAGVYDATDRLVASLVRTAPRDLPLHVRVQPPYYLGDRVVVTYPVRQNGGAIGVVYLEVTIDSGLERFFRYSGLILLLTMAVLMMGLLGAVQQALTRTNARLLTEMAERSKIEEALRQSHKMEALGQLAGGIAHDFNNLMAIVKGSLQLMQRRLGPATADVQRFMDAAFETVDRAAAVTQRVLAFSRRQSLKPESLDLSKLVGDMLELIRQSAGGAIAIRTQLQADWLVQCDANQMENVIINLSVNARDAMPNGGILTIETANVMLDGSLYDIPQGGYVRLAIRDTGIGMSDETLQRALDPFFTTKPYGKGTGLGLSMASGFINQSKGFLQLDSAVGKGTTVTIWLPRVAALEAGVS